MNISILPHSHDGRERFTQFELSTTTGRVFVESDREYWQDKSLPDLVRLTDDGDSHMLLSPAEALSVAAALQAVAVDILEQQSRGKVAA